MPSSDELRLKGQLEEKDKELHDMKLALRSRDKEITDLKRRLERAQRRIGTDAVELPETMGTLSERINRMEQDHHRLQQQVSDLMAFMQKIPAAVKGEIDSEIVDAMKTAFPFVVSGKESE